MNASKDALPADWSSKAMVGFGARLKEHRPEEKAFIVNADFVATYKVEWPIGYSPIYDPDEETDVEVTCSFDLVYDIVEGSEIDASDLEHFAIMNGTFNAWPYWRELAQATTLRMGVPPLIVQLFVFPKSVMGSEEDSGN